MPASTNTAAAGISITGPSSCILRDEKGELVTGYQCDSFTVDEEFLLTRRKYQQTTGREQRHEVIAYQIRQSFRPGEITPEEANRLGRELALRFTKGKI